MLHTYKHLTIALLAVGLFYLANQFRLLPHDRITYQPPTQVVIAAPVQVLMYAGDRFLAADLESIRLAAIGTSEERAIAEYRIRSHELVSSLNPCHEDNYFHANANLSWGGSAKMANIILERATECRHWDFVPPFFLSFNRYFFDRDLDGAIRAVNIAAQRSEENRSSLESMAILMSAKKLKDEEMAANYLRNERDSTTDPALAKMLDRRLKRLEGLLTLRTAQARFEQQHGRPLAKPEELLSSGILDVIPEDPTRIGYELVNGRFQLRAIIIGGVEIRQ